MGSMMLDLFEFGVDGPDLEGSLYLSAASIICFAFDSETNLRSVFSSSMDFEEPYEVSMT